MMFNERIWTVFKQNWQHTLTYWSVFFSFGLSISFLGPTVLDLRCQTQSTLQEITCVFFAQQFFLLVGSSVGGLFKETQKCALSALFTCTLLISMVFAIVPLCHSLLLLAVALATGGLAMGIIDTIANFQLVKIYQKDSAVFLQVLHFFIGLGALVSPLIAEPFLSETNCVLGAANATSELRHLRKTLGRNTAHNWSHYHLLTEGIVVTQVAYAFWIMAIISLPVPLVVLALLHRERALSCCCRARSPRLLDQEGVDMKTWAAGPGEEEPKNLHTEGHGGLFSCCRNKPVHTLSPFSTGVHILGGLVVFMTDGIIGVYSVFVYSYAVDPPLALKHKTAGYLSSVFWAAITVGRLISVPMSCRVRPVHMLIGNLAGMVITTLLLLLLHTHGMFLFVGTFFLGLFLSSVFPCMLAYAEDTLDYQGCVTTFVVTCAGTGEMVLQVVVGSFMHRTGSYSFLLCTMVIASVGFILFCVLLLFRHMHR
ncbi:hypothetical protein COCON_G00177250 [Conger conger]|uniref:Major facilitator superfamily domain-containing protein 4A n=1 Tax=Conger conger TaxID=82655 RepID=A0A9Q1D5I5_CONCO|nr:hypothetical protein COCON_G00177250 [Conger conger]